MAKVKVKTKSKKGLIDASKFWSGRESGMGDKEALRSLKPDTWYRVDVFSREDGWVGIGKDSIDWWPISGDESPFYDMDEELRNEIIISKMK